jgi:hypothetical protein
MSVQSAPWRIEPKLCRVKDCGDLKTNPTTGRAEDLFHADRRYLAILGKQTSSFSPVILRLAAHGGYQNKVSIPFSRLSPSRSISSRLGRADLSQVLEHPGATVNFPWLRTVLRGPEQAEERNPS